VAMHSYLTMVGLIPVEYCIIHKEKASTSREYALIRETWIFLKLSEREQKIIMRFS
jgi:hypothetical protein